MNVKVQHSGNDGGKINDIVLWTTQQTLKDSFQCLIQKKLDHDESTSANCNKIMADPNQDLSKESRILSCL